jgi:GNAT superfamily N-acetyltransferase
MTAELLVRPTRPDDKAALLEQFLGLNRHEAAIAGDRRTDRAGAAESLRAATSDIARFGGAALVAELGGQVVGHLFLVLRQDPVHVREDLRYYGYVTDLFVRSEARGAGVATALMREAERIAAASGMRRLMVGVLAGNAPAESLYQTLGYLPRALELAKPLPVSQSPARS